MDLSAVGQAQTRATFPTAPCAFTKCRAPEGATSWGQPPSPVRTVESGIDPGARHPYFPPSFAGAVIFWPAGGAYSSAVEHLTFNQVVDGSIPSGLTNIIF